MIESVVFFDGVCNLCDSFVRFLIKIDKKDRLRFASLQGSTAGEKLPISVTQEMASVYLLHKDQIYNESSAILEIFKIIGGPWSLLYVFKILPSNIRDSIYKYIANNRYKWFGQKDEVCPMPTPKQRSKVLP